MRFIWTFFATLPTLVLWLLIISLANGLDDVILKLMLPANQPLPPTNIAILVPSILFFLALFFEYLPCLKSHKYLPRKDLYDIAKATWLAGVILNMLLVIAIGYREQSLLMLNLPDNLEAERVFDTGFAIATIFCFMVPVAIIRFCVMMQCFAYGTIYNENSSR